MTDSQPYSSATFDRDSLYRFRLTRDWVGGGFRVCWFLLNPSTATAHEDDPTIRRVIGFSRAWRFGSVVVVNLFALRSTDPSNLFTAPDPVGPDNDIIIARAAASSCQIVVAWGTHGETHNPATGVPRDREVLTLLAHTEILCLGRTANGQPRHPLYLPATATPFLFGVDGRRAA
ncbi:MAG TPA: DUF1643 domain-containing protein [Acidimicrobiia bacterium]|nr:DUF1643 domain-containing protein [Acidimicrobiia bacterium]